MNVIANLFRGGSRRRLAGRVGGGDREFLPAALEILETPPSPVRMSLLLLICGFVAVA